MPVAGCVNRILRSSRARATPSAGGFAGCELRGGFGNDRLEIAGRSYGVAADRRRDRASND
jgi:hypothetical protein